MKKLLITIAAVVLVGCGPKAPDISIHRATQEGNIEAVKQHLAAGTDVNENDSIQSPLHYAESKEIAKLLIANGADINAKSNVGTALSPLQSEGGYTPLDFANHVWDGLEGSKIKTLKIETADLLRKHGGKTSEELKAEGK